jgi:small subunit ribosomal protein S1
METDEGVETGGRIVRKPPEALPQEGGRGARSEYSAQEALLCFQERKTADGSAQSYPAGTPPTARGGEGNHRSLKEQRGVKLKHRLAALLDSGDYGRVRPRRGEIIEATILSIGENDMVVGLGAKRDGIVPPRDLSLVDDEEYLASLEVGDRIPVVVLRDRGYGSEILVSLNQGLQQQAWLRAQKLFESGEIFEAQVADLNRGGVVVSFDRLRGFVPNSHLTSIPRGLRGRRLRELKSKLLGQTLSLTVIEVDRPRRRLVLSERAATRQKRHQLLQDLVEGEVRTGVVRSLVDFGAFVDLGGLDGLIHISELDWTHVDHPSDVLSVGDRVEVYVLDVDRDRERIALSRKRLLPDPWHRVVGELHEGDSVEGTVTSVAPFGIFVDVGYGVEGLVHISKMPRQSATGLDLEVGSPVTVCVLSIDEWRHRIALRLQAVGSR